MIVDQSQTIQNIIDEISRTIENGEATESYLNGVISSLYNTLEIEISASLANKKFKSRLHCFGCGKSVSTGIPKTTLVRALVTCPECLEKESELIIATARYRCNELKGQL